MSLFEDLSKQLAPHTRHLTDTIAYHGQNITERLDELRQESDLGRPDTEDQFKFLIVRGKIGATGPVSSVNPGPNQTSPSGPTLGEIWTIQSICVNGIPNKSPGFTLRTNTGRLIFAVVKEGMGNEGVGGDVILLQGEELVFEPEAEGVFDFTISVVQRKYQRQAPDAGYGVSDNVYENRYRAEHERTRDFGGQAYTPEVSETEFGGNISPDPIIAGEPAGTYPET